MADFVLHATSRMTADECFERLVDWDAHSASIPFTRLQHEGVPRVGQRFVARTGLGPVGFDDPMVVDALEPPQDDRPGSVQITKQGRVVSGTVAWTVAPTPLGSDVTWTQHLVIGWLPQWLDGVVGAVGKRAYAMGLSRLVQ